MKSVIFILFSVCPLVAILFAVRLGCAPFSSKITAQIGSHPVWHGIWGVFAFFGMLILLGLVNSYFWPPISVERRTQRIQVMERVKASGGWDVIKSGCIELVERNTNGFSSRWGDTNGLPATIAGLHPLAVQYEPHFGCVRIGIFGTHSTGGHSIPYFGLEVDTSTNSVNYQHGMGYDNGGVTGNFHSTCNQVVKGVYEIY